MHTHRLRNSKTKKRRKPHRKYRNRPSTLCRSQRRRRKKIQCQGLLRQRRLRYMRGGEEIAEAEECQYCFDRPANCTIQHSDGDNTVPHRICEQCWNTYSKGKNKNVCPACRRQITSCVRDDGVILEKAQVPVPVYRKNVLPMYGDTDEPCLMSIYPIDGSEGKYRLSVETIEGRKLFQVEFKYNRRSVHITKVECMDQTNAFFELDESRATYIVNGRVISQEEGETLNNFIHSNFANAYPQISQAIVRYIRGEHLGERVDEEIQRQYVPCDAGLFTMATTNASASAPVTASVI